MKTSLRYVLTVAAFAAACLLRAENKTNPVMIVQVIETSETDAYVAMIAKLNARTKTVTGHDQLRHVWEGDWAGDNAHGIFVVSVMDSAAAVASSMEKMKADAELSGLVASLKPLRKLGPAHLYKAVRYEGGYAGGAVFNTSVSTTDENAYAHSLDGLKAIFDANGFKDARLSLWRIAAGRDPSMTHLVVIAFPNQVRVGELIDAISDQGLLKDWNAAAAKIRTVLHNGTYHEITK
jgi:hypothetical protein